jgi:tetratricopeptide (TPR) repeat protein
MEAESIPQRLARLFGVHWVDLARNPRAAGFGVPNSASRASAFRTFQILAGRYRVLNRLRSGGMGEVHVAQDLVLRRLVALKTLKLELARPADQAELRALMQRFYTEACVSSQLAHPSIVPIHDLLMLADNTLVMVMKLVEGLALDQAMRELLAKGEQQALLGSVRRRVELLNQAVQALKLAHEQNVLHRDLKPANIMVGHYKEVYVMDWGLAKLLGDASGDGIIRGFRLESDATSPLPSSPGVSLGTASYSSPEQASGLLDQIDQRTDVFGLGAVLYFLITGQAPYSAENETVVLAYARERRLSDPTGTAGPLKPDGELLGIALKAMAADRNDRYESASDFGAALDAYLGHRVARGVSIPLWKRAGKYARRKPRTCIAAAGALLALALYGQVRLQRDTILAIETAMTEQQRWDSQRALVAELALLPGKLIFPHDSDARIYKRSLLPIHGRDARHLADLDQVANIEMYARVLAPIFQSTPEAPLGTDVDRACAELDDLRSADAQLHAQLLDALYRLMGLLVEPIPLAQAAEWQAGRLPQLLYGLQPESAEGLAQRFSGYIRLWLMIREVTRRQEPDPQVREIVESFLEQVTTGQERLEELIDRDTSDWKAPRARLVLAILYSAVYGYGNALDYWAELARDFPASFDAHSTLCFAGATGGDARTGIEHGMAAMALEPQAPVIRIALATMWMQFDLGKALDHARAAYICLGPDAHRVAGTLGFLLNKCYLQSGDAQLLQESQLVIDRTLAAQYSSPYIWHNQADLHLHAGRVSAAIEVLKGALQEFPESAYLSQGLLRAYKQSGDWENCAEVLIDLNRRFPTRLDVLAELAALMHSHFRWEHSIPLLQQALDAEINPAWRPPLESDLANSRASLALACAPDPPSGVKEQAGLARSLFERQEYLRAAELFAVALNHLEGSLTGAEWFDQVGLDPWSIYSIAAQAAARAAAGLGFVHTRGALLTWYDQLPALGAIEGWQTTNLRAQDRATLANAPAMQAGLAEPLDERCRDWLRRAILAAVEDYAAAQPILNADERSAIAARLANDAWLQPYLEDISRSGLQAEVATLLDWVADKKP